MKKAHPILQALIPIAEGISKTIGDNCEVAIHDLTRPRNSIFYIANGSLTGRKKGDSLGPLFKKVVELATVNEESLINYYAFENGHPLKCTKVLIRDDKGKLIGCFCINISIKEYLQVKQVVDELAFTEPISKFEPKNKKRNVQNNNGQIDDISELAEDMIVNTYNDFFSAKGHLNKKDKIEMVKFLDDKGIFNVRGSVEMLASLMEVSKFTIYNYLDQVRNSEHSW